MAHIIQVTTFFHPVKGGVEQVVLDLSKELVRCGHEVTVFCSNSTRSKKKIAKKRDRLGKIHIRRFPTWFGFSQFYKIYPQLFFALLRTKFDIVHVHCFRRFDTYPALFAAKLKRKKIVLTTHNPFTVTKESRSFLLRFSIKLHDLTFGKLFTRFIDKIICLVKDEIPILMAFGVKEENIEVIPNGIPNEMFKKGEPLEFLTKYKIPHKDFQNIVFWIGRINKVKGLENLETAVKQLHEVLFIFAGPDDNASKEIKGLYKECKNVIFTGRIPHEEVIHAYAASDLYVLPSHHEPFGVVLLEAMAQRLPIIASNSGGPTQIIKSDFGILQDPTDQWAWLFNIKKLLINTKLRKQMSIAARREANRYKWSNLIDLVLGVYGV
jgi:glycosyltransferase involved in cell wall biosynthesis